MRVAARCLTSQFAIFANLRTDYTGLTICMATVRKLLVLYSLFRFSGIAFASDFSIFRNVNSSGSHFTKNRSKYIIRTTYKLMIYRCYGTMWFEFKKMWTIFHKTRSRLLPVNQCEKEKKNNFLFSYRNNATFTMYSEVMRLIGELKFVNILLGYDTTPGRQTTIFSNNSYNNLKQQNTTFRYF